MWISSLLFVSTSETCILVFIYLFRWNNVLTYSDISSSVVMKQSVLPRKINAKYVVTTSSHCIYVSICACAFFLSPSILPLFHPSFISSTSLPFLSLPLSHYRITCSFTETSFHSDQIPDPIYCPITYTLPITKTYNNLFPDLKDAKI